MNETARETNQTGEVRAAVVEAEVDFVQGTDPAAVGAIVSDELCGAWDHDGPCRWPHRNEIEEKAAPDAATNATRFRTVIVAPAAELPEALERTEAALRRDPRWSVVSAATREPAGDERELVDRLFAAPRLAD